MSIERAKITAKQLFVLVVLFEMGSAMMVGFPLSLKQDAWIGLLIATALGVLLFFIYYHLFKLYPDLPLTSYLQEIAGKWIGRVLGYLYILYFTYLAARVLRDFGELLTSTIYTNTPLFVLMTITMITCAYAIQKGFEVIARFGELLFVVVYILAIVGFTLIIISKLIHLEYLRPILENGWIPIIKTVLKGTITFPFGEMVVFTVLLPYLNQQKKVKQVCIWGIVLSGINLTIAAAINIATLGIDLFIRSPYPLLSTISKIQLANFIERLDVLFMVYLMIGGFIKTTIFYYAAVIGTADLFHFKDYRKISFPIGVIVLVSSMMIAANYTEHINEGQKIVPIYLHWPMQIIIPSLLLAIGQIRKHSKQTKKTTTQTNS